MYSFQFKLYVCTNRWNSFGGLLHSYLLLPLWVCHLCKVKWKWESFWKLLSFCYRNPILRAGMFRELFFTILLIAFGFSATFQTNRIEGIYRINKLWLRNFFISGVVYVFILEVFSYNTWNVFILSVSCVQNIWCFVSDVLDRLNYNFKNIDNKIVQFRISAIY